MISKLKPEATYGGVMGRVLALRRQEIGREQADIAQQMGITQPTWSRIESGDSALTVDQLAQAAKALRTTPAVILQNVELAIADLTRQGIRVKHGSTRELAKEGLAIVGVVALTALVLAAISAK